MVNKPAILLTNEPIGNLDDALSNSILRLFEEFNRVAVTLLMETHDTWLIARRNYHIFTLNSEKNIRGIYGMVSKLNRSTRANILVKAPRLQTAGEVETAKFKLRGGRKQQWYYAWLNTLADM